ncbi:uncharacterized protein LOC134696959 [Mytilus trossulus]|uniref:uncharacterized protein LOC134696959 n=1 Tax=Mytilus trossulus TaxID=6551 RepID=UPI00300412C5
MDSICNPCERRDVVSKLTHWCSDCEDGLCGKCFKDHQAMKLTQYHHVSEMAQMSIEKSKLLSIPQCERHQDCREDFICLDHDLICCHACIKLDHKDCKKVSNVNVLSKGVKESELFISIKRTVQDLRETITEILKERQSVKENVKKQQQRVKMEIANTKSKFMEHINNLEKSLIQELSNIEKETKNLIEEEMDQLLKTEEGFDEDDKALQFIADNGSEGRLFTYLRKQRRKQEDIEKMLQEVSPTSRVKISFEEASHGYKAIKALGFFSVHYEIVESERALKRSTIEKDSDNTAQTVSVQSNEATTTPTECIRKFPMLEETLQIQLDPKDFIGRDEKYAKLNLRNVCLGVRDDNFLLIGGHVTILEEHTERNKPSKYKNNFSVVKYVHDDKGLTFVNGYSIYCEQYTESAHECSMNIALSCIPKSTQAVYLYGKSFELIDTESMESQWSLELDNEFQALATDEKFIYISNNNTMYKYNRIGCLLTHIRFINCSSFASTLNGNFACHSVSFRLMSGNGSEIFSYHPAVLKGITVDDDGNIYLATRDGIQVLDPLKMTTEMVYRYDKEVPNSLMGVVCNRDKQLVFIQRQKSKQGGDFGYVFTNRYSAVICKLSVKVEEFSIHVLTRSNR